MLTVLLTGFLSLQPINSTQTFVDSVWSYILQCEIQHPEVVMRQAVHETGWFKAEFLMKKNNLFAFRYKNKYITFENWKSSVEYYKRWQDRHFVDSKYKDYYQFLIKRGYAEDPNYVTRLKSLKLKHRLKMPETLLTESVN